MVMARLSTGLWAPQTGLENSAAAAALEPVSPSGSVGTVRSAAAQDWWLAALDRLALFAARRSVR